MAKESVNILKDKIDIVDLLAQLNAALSEEWLAFYQYWVGSFVVEGAMRGDVQREFQEHAAEEYNHAKLLADRIIELEGVPVLDPKQWFDLARCKYDAPVDFGSEILLKQNVESERCAIYRYQQIAEFTNGIDFTTCDIAKHIMAEEEDHEQDLQDYLNDIARMKAYILKNNPHLLLFFFCFDGERKVRPVSTAKTDLILYYSCKLPHSPNKLTHLTCESPTNNIYNTWRILTSLVNSPSSKSSFNIFAPSLLATEGSSWVSINKPSTPTAMPALATVSIRRGMPPVTPAV